MRGRGTVAGGALAVLLAGCLADAPAEPAARAERVPGAEAALGESAAGGPAGTGPVIAQADVPGIVRTVEPSIVTVLRPDGQGSGVVYDEEGLIVTNYHVIAGARDLAVQFADASRAPAELVAGAPDFDLAVLRVDRDGLPAATFADDLPQVGELAVALGSPLGFEGSATAGIISGLQRSLPASQTNRNPLVNLIQTDAPISPGNSGGALVGPGAEVVGINVAYLPPGQTGAVAIGFAIPSTTVVDVVEQLVATGEVREAFLGVQAVPLTAQVIEQFGVQADRGVLVVGVVEGSPAEDAGLERGDVVTAIDGRPIDDLPDLQGALREVGADATVTLTVVRDGEEREIEADLADRPAVR